MTVRCTHKNPVLINSCAFLKYLIILSVCGIDSVGLIASVLGPTVAKQSREYYHRRGE